MPENGQGPIVIRLTGTITYEFPRLGLLQRLIHPWIRRRSRLERLEADLAELELRGKLDPIFPEHKRGFNAEVAERLSSLFFARDVRAEFDFSKGTIVFEGVVVVVLATAALSASLTFIRQVSEAAKFVVRNVISSYARPPEGSRLVVRIYSHPFDETRARYTPTALVIRRIFMLQIIFNMVLIVLLVLGFYGDDIWAAAEMLAGRERRASPSPIF